MQRTACFSAGGLQVADLLDGLNLINVLDHIGIAAGGGCGSSERTKSTTRLCASKIGGPILQVAFHVCAIACVFGAVEKLFVFFRLVLVALLFSCFTL